MEKGIIYKITNKVNGKLYIGQTCRLLSDRFKEHLYNTSKPEKCVGLYGAMKKHGVDNFTIELVEECAIPELNDREIFYISHFNSFTGSPNSNGYNLTKGGDNIFGASGEYHYLNQMSEEEKYSWMVSNRIGENNGMFNNGKLLAGDKHFLNKMNDFEREKWLDTHLRGENNYQSKMTEDDLSEKCWINKLSDAELLEYKMSMSGENNPFFKAIKRNPEKYTGVNAANYGNTGKKSKLAKYYLVTFPTGEEIVTKSIADFCESEIGISLNLKRPGFYNVVAGRTYNYRGFKCRYATEEEIKNFE